MAAILILFKIFWCAKTNATNIGKVICATGAPDRFQQNNTLKICAVLQWWSVDRVADHTKWRSAAICDGNVSIPLPFAALHVMENSENPVQGSWNLSDTFVRLPYSAAHSFVAKRKRDHGRESVCACVCAKVLFYQNYEKFLCKLTLFSNDSKLHSIHTDMHIRCEKEGEKHWDIQRARRDIHIIIVIINWYTNWRQHCLH